MKKSLALFVLFFASSALAQNAKVLVCAPGNLAAAKSTDSVLAKFYSDPIDVSDTITNRINNYEVIFLLIPWHQISFSEGKLLLSYLRSNNRIYIEYGYATFSPYYNWDSSGFWKYSGVIHAGIASVGGPVDEVHGINGTFTESMDIHVGLIDVPSKVIVESAGTNILYTSNPAFGPTFYLGYIYETDSFKVALHWPAIPIYYYDDFLHRVICNYFGLCTPASVKQNAENIALQISLFPNPARDVLHILGSSGLQSATLYSETGSFISRFSLDRNSSRFDLDLSKLNLTSGNYLLNVETPKESFSKKVFLLR